MRTLTLLSLSTTLSLLLTTSSSSVVTPQRRQEPGATDNAIILCLNSPSYDSTCWDLLNVGDYVNKWWAANKGLCLQQSLPFVPCFLNRTYIGGELLNYCQHVGENYRGSSGQSACPLLASDTKGKLHIKDLKPYSKTPQDAYILYHIAAQWLWFQSISDVLTARGGIHRPFTTGIEPLLRLFGNTTKPRLRINKNRSYSSITAGLLDMKLPAGSANFSSLLQASPRDIEFFTSLYTPLLSAEPDNDSFVFDGTMFSVRELGEGYAYQLSLVLAANITSDPTLFNEFSAGGAFIAEERSVFVYTTLCLLILLTAFSSLVAETDHLFQKFYTWLTSSILNGKRINISVARDTDPYTFHKFGHDGAVRLNCDYYEPEGICSAWWHDSSTNTTYGLDSYDEPAHNYYSTMKQLFTNYTTGELLFAGADACNSTGRRDGITINGTTGTVDCVAASNLISFNQTCADVGCQFSAGSTGSYPAWRNQKCFPPSYIGVLRSTPGDFRPCTDALLGTKGS